MRYWKPEVELASRLPRQLRREDKLGGRPFGLPAARWPRCTSCRAPMTLVAQLEHDWTRLNLGADGRVLFAFQCNADPPTCETWAARSGANAIFVLDPEELREGWTALPDDAGAEDGEVRVVAWHAYEDGISVDDAHRFFTEDEYLELPDATRDRVDLGTRIGSVPSWIRSPGDSPPPPWVFALQIDSGHRLAWTPRSADEVGCPVSWRRADGTSVHEEPIMRRPGAPSSIIVDETGSYCAGSRFGNGGMAFVFLRARGAAPPLAVMFWQSG